MAPNQHGLRERGVEKTCKFHKLSMISQEIRTVNRAPDWLFEKFRTVRNHITNDYANK